MTKASQIEDHSTLRRNCSSEVANTSVSVHTSTAAVIWFCFHPGYVRHAAVSPYLEYSAQPPVVKPTASAYYTNCELLQELYSGI